MLGQGRPHSDQMVLDGRRRPAVTTAVQPTYICLAWAFCRLLPGGSVHNTLLLSECNVALPLLKLAKHVEGDPCCASGCSLCLPVLP